jgi:hypothetical protein
MYPPDRKSSIFSTSIAILLNYTQLFLVDFPVMKLALFGLLTSWIMNRPTSRPIFSLPRSVQNMWIVMVLYYLLWYPLQKIKRCKDRKNQKKNIYMLLQGRPYQRTSLKNTSSTILEWLLVSSTTISSSLHIMTVCMWTPSHE